MGADDKAVGGDIPVLVRKPRLLALAAMLAVAGAVAVLAVTVHWLFMMAMPFALAGAYGAWLGLSGKEMLGASQGTMSTDPSVGWSAGGF